MAGADRVRQFADADTGKNACAIWLTVITPSPPLFSDLRILKNLKWFVLLQIWKCGF